MRLSLSLFERARRPLKLLDRNAAAIGVGRVVRGVLNAVVIIVQAATMAAGAFAETSLTLLIVLNAPLLAMSPGLVLTRYVASGKIGRTSGMRLIRNSSIQAGVFACGLYAVVATTSRAMHPEVGMFAVVGLAAIAVNWRTAEASRLRGELNFVRGEALEVWVAVLYVAATVAIAFSVGLTPTSAIAILAASNSAPAARFRSAKWSQPKHGHAPSSEIRRFRFAASGIGLVQAMTYQLDSYILAAHASERDLATYLVVVRIGELVAFVPTVLASLRLPVSAARGPTFAAWNDTLQRWKPLAAAAVAFAVVLSFAPYRWSDSYPGVVQTSLILLPSFALLSSTRLLSAYVTAVSSLRPFVITSLVTFAVAGGLYSLLIPAYGRVGAASASAVAYLVASILAVAVFARTRPR